MAMRKIKQWAGYIMGLRGGGENKMKDRRIVSYVTQREAVNIAELAYRTNSTNSEIVRLAVRQYLTSKLEGGNDGHKKNHGRNRGW